MTQVQKLVALLTAIVGLLASLSGAVVHLQQEAVQRDRDRDHIRQLEHIIVSEFPAYAPAITWDDK